MKTFSTLFMGVLLGALSLHGLAQNESDVLRYGWIDPLHSARVTAMGGSFGALGADLSCLGMNPAGLGLYRRGDLSVNAGIHSGSTEARWRNRKVDAAGSAVVGSNIGVALTYPSIDADWPFFTLAVAHQNRSPFDQSINIDGVPADLSVSDVFVTQALDDAATYGFLSTDSALGDGIIFPFGASLAWRAGLLQPDNATGYATLAGDNVLVDRTIDRTGRMAETQIGFGTMYQDRISFGLTLGIPKVEYEETSKHTEEVNAVSPTLQRWEYNESLRITGRGYLLRFGVLARVSESLRVGLAYQTRSRLTLTDTYSTDIETTWLDDSQFRAISPTSNAEYLVYTPDRTTISASFLLGKLGVLNADYVRSDMTRGELGESDGILALDYDFKPENDAVQQGYRVVHQARVGLELRVGENDEFRIRGGGGMSTSPFVPEAVQSNANRYNASVGAGYRIANVHFSAAWRTAWHSEDFYFMGAFSPDPLASSTPFVRSSWVQASGSERWMRNTKKAHQ